MFQFSYLPYFDIIYILSTTTDLVPYNNKFIFLQLCSSEAWRSLTKIQVSVWLCSFLKPLKESNLQPLHSSACLWPSSPVIIAFQWQCFFLHMSFFDSSPAAFFHFLLSNWIIQDKPSISNQLISNLNSICNLNSSLSCNVHRFWD